MIHQFIPESLSNRFYGAIHTPSLAQIEQTYPSTPVWGIEEGFDMVQRGMVDAIKKVLRDWE